MFCRDIFAIFIEIISEIVGHDYDWHCNSLGIIMNFGHLIQKLRTKTIQPFTWSE